MTFSSKLMSLIALSNFVCIDTIVAGQRHFVHQKTFPNQIFTVFRNWVIGNFHHVCLTAAFHLSRFVQTSEDELYSWSVVLPCEMDPGEDLLLRIGR
jgi:hypothetical protein